jgi:hypothetical protein
LFTVKYLVSSAKKRVLATHQEYSFKMKVVSTLFATSVAFSVANAQVAAYGQCGGTTYTGVTSCTAGFYCTSYNPYYYQCIPGTGS